jgi:hypothetical protein
MTGFRHICSKGNDVAKAVEMVLSEQDQVLSDFLGRRWDWSNQKHDFYTALVRKKFSVDTQIEGARTRVSVTAFGFTLSAVDEEPFKALAEAAVRTIRFHEATTNGDIQLAKESVTFATAYHWLLRGLDIRRANWPKGKYVSLIMGLVGDQSSVASFMPDELFQVVSGTSLPMMPRLVMTDGEQQARYDWCAIGVDIMATDWEAF